MVEKHNHRNHYDISADDDGGNTDDNTKCKRKCQKIKISSTNVLTLPPSSLRRRRRSSSSLRIMSLNSYHLSTRRHRHPHRLKWGPFTSFTNNLSNSAIILATIITLILSCCTAHGFLLDGSQNSFAQFRKWYTGLNGTLEFEFKTEQPNGLVLYTDDGGTFDFFEIKLVEGAVRLRYNLGGGANIITVGRDLHDGHWHKVQVCGTFSFVKF